MPDPTCPFHLALPVTDLDATRAFYTDLLGCPTGRESSRWVDLDFFGHQLVLHLVEPEHHPAAASNAVDGHDVPAGHFGPVLDWADWERLSERLRAHGIGFLIEPYVRFEGQAGEQGTFFIQDPSGNALEFKTFRDISKLFSTDLEQPV
ncbi:VOC family protein [Wenzhouxiangella sp. XN79A]|uniref:VOC family protein n=1 Tax=Wenzhouxiangella sp. XN79A TaxID=2724193 RepID=UPI00144AB3A3|nr:VOC family protein [Wenzhouxiangella sp. XN79A]NKI34703.1 VOC family protein [Wenzhouxiangella sp. XN79A]